MDELDILKKDWQRRDPGFPEVSEKQIYGMLHRKSSSVVKWILIISIVEFCFWIAISFLGGSDRYLGVPGPTWIPTMFEVMDVINYGVTLIFIYLFYNNFRRISTTSSTRELMKNIIKTRNTVNYYVRYNLFMVVVLMILFSAIGMAYHPNSQDLQERIQDNPSVLIAITLILLLGIGLIGVVVWLFYKLLYGILLKRLNANYRELKKIDI